MSLTPFHLAPTATRETAPVDGEGEQATMFFLDPSGNAPEFKAFNDIERQLFET